MSFSCNKPLVLQHKGKGSFLVLKWSSAKLDFTPVFQRVTDTPYPKALRAKTARSGISCFPYFNCLWILKFCESFIAPVRFLKNTCYLFSAVQDLYSLKTGVPCFSIRFPMRPTLTVRGLSCWLPFFQQLSSLYFQNITEWGSLNTVNVLINIPLAGNSSFPRWRWQILQIEKQKKHLYFCPHLDRSMTLLCSP